MNVVQLHSIANEIQKTKQKKRTGENQKKKGKTLGRRRKLSLYLSDFVLLRWHVCNYYLAASSLCVCLVKMCWLFLKTNTHPILVVYLTHTHARAQVNSHSHITAHTQLPPTRAQRTDNRIIMHTPSHNNMN